MQDGLSRIGAPVEDTIALLSGRRIRTSGAFSGIGSPEIADEIISNTAGDFIKKNFDSSSAPAPKPIEFVSMWAIEKDDVCRAELLEAPNGPRHIFGDICDFLPSNWRAACGLDGNTPWPIEKLAATLPFAKLKTKAWCYKCQKLCSLFTTDMHRAGTPCVNHSRMGKRESFESSSEFLFYVWASLLRQLLTPVVLHENVCEFGSQVIRDVFADLYVSVRIALAPQDLGWPSSRPRQITFLLLRTFISKLSHDTSKPATTAVALESLRLEDTLRTMFCRSRHSDLHWRCYMVSTQEEIEADMRWAASRPGTKIRWQGANQEDNLSPDEFKDARHSALGCLTLAERRRFVHYMTHWPEEACNVGQDPAARPTHTRNGVMFTLIRSSGIIMTPPSDGAAPRWLTPQELATSMGFPIHAEAQAACGNTACLFSRQSPGCRKRSSHSVRAQIGNAMHINVIGAAIAVVILRLPMLGEVRSQRPAESSAAKSMFSTLFQALGRGRKRARE